MRLIDAFLNQRPFFRDTQLRGPTRNACAIKGCGFNFENAADVAQVFLAATNLEENQLIQDYILRCGKDCRQSV
jgi:hypothetical protein